MNYRDYQLLDGFLIGRGTRLRRYQSDDEKEVATHLIGGLVLDGVQSSAFGTGTVVYFEGNTFGTKAFPNVSIGPRDLSTQTGGFWTRLTQRPELIQSARIDRQKYQTEFNRQFCNYQVQIGQNSIACLLLLVDVAHARSTLRRAFNLSLELAREVMICPTDPRQSYMHIKSQFSGA